jgi:hypothetical protein
MEEKQVFAVMTNTDLTEGRGRQYIKAFCETEATARRIGHRGYVQGGNCPIEKKMLYKPDGQARWYGPVFVEAPSIEDEKLQSVLDARNAALEKAKSLGLTDDEISQIQNKQ